MSRLRVGDTAPLKLVINVTPSTLVPDLTKVADAVLRVRRPTDGTGAAAWWACTLSNKTPTTLRLTHMLAEGDLGWAGTYAVKAEMTVLDLGTVRTDPVEFEVLGEYEPEPA